MSECANAVSCPCESVFQVAAPTDAAACPTPPAAPTSLQGFFGVTDGDLTWSYGTNPLWDFVIYYGTNSGLYTKFAKAPASSRSHGFTGLTSGTTYYFVVVARNTGQCVSVFSAELTVTTG